MRDIASEIFTILSHDILHLRLLPGQGVSEGETCERFHASRTPVRTAFQRLSDASLLEILPYQGARCTLMDFSAIRECIYMREVLESQVIADFIDKADDFMFEDVEHQLRLQRILVASEYQMQDFYALDTAFHKTWFDALDYPLIWKTIAERNVDYTRFKMLDLSLSQHNADEIMADHEKLYALMKDRCKTGVQELLKYHLEGGIRRMDGKLKTDYAGYFA